MNLWWLILLAVPFVLALRFRSGRRATRALARGSQAAAEDADLTGTQHSFALAREASLGDSLPELPGYELQASLGSGAFGRVFRAIQTSTGQSVAVKVLNAGVAPQNWLAEVQRLSEVSEHPNIVTLVDANLEHSPAFMVTPLLPGSLESQVPDQDDEVDLERVCVWFEQVARAMMYVHGRGILHCDLKPSNILLGEEGQARVVDFGQSTDLREKQLRLGTFWYMAPEQARAAQGQELPSVGWDIYALGATFYRLLTGSLPRATREAQETLGTAGTARERLAIYQQLLEDSTLQPLRELNAGVDRELAAIVERCLAWNSDERFATMAELLDDLQRRRQMRPLRSREPRAGYLLERFFARHKLAVTIAAAALAGLLGTFSWASYKVVKAREAQQALVAQQYDRGVRLLQSGRSSGLVWIAWAAAQEPGQGYLRSLEGYLEKHLAVAGPELYLLPTSTAPSPSGKFGIMRDPNQPDQRVLVDLSDGSLRPLPQELSRVDWRYKDTLRFLLDGVVLDPVVGKGGPAVWSIAPFESFGPYSGAGLLALMVSPDRVLKANRPPLGALTITDRQGRALLPTAELEPDPSRGMAIPAFSTAGDLAIGWDNGEVKLYLSDQSHAPRLLHPQFHAELFRFSPGGKLLAAHDGGDEILVWDREGEVVARLSLGAGVNDIAFDEEGRLLVCVTRDGMLHGFDLLAGVPAWPSAELERAARWVMIQPDGKLVTMSDRVIVWKMPDQHPPLQAHDLESLKLEIAVKTGWVLDQNARIRMLRREEYLDAYQRWQERQKK